MATVFGKLVRQFRAEQAMLLKDLADAISVTSAYLSAVEIGTKKITEKLIVDITHALNLSVDDQQRLRQAAQDSPVKVSISLHNADAHDRELVAAFAREVFELPQDRKDLLRKMLLEDSK